MTGAKKFEKGPCSTKKSKNDSVPPKFEKRPCSTKIWQATMLHQKIWKATMLHRKKNMTVFHQNVTNGLKIWWNVVISQILAGHFFRPTCPQLRAFSKNNPVPKFEKWPCSIKKWKWSCSTKMWQMTSNFGGTLDFWACLSAIKSFLKKWPCSTKIWETTMLHQKK